MQSQQVKFGEKKYLSCKIYKKFKKKITKNRQDVSLSRVKKSVLQKVNRNRSEKRLKQKHKMENKWRKKSQTVTTFEQATSTPAKIDRKKSFWWKVFRKNSIKIASNRKTGCNMRIKRESPCLGLRFMPIKLGKNHLLLYISASVSLLLCCFYLQNKIIITIIIMKIRHYSSFRACISWVCVWVVSFFSLPQRARNEK